MWKWPVGSSHKSVYLNHSSVWSISILVLEDLLSSVSCPHVTSVVTSRHHIFITSHNISRSHVSNIVSSWASGPLRSAVPTPLAVNLRVALLDRLAGGLPRKSTRKRDRCHVKTYPKVPEVTSTSSTSSTFATFNLWKSQTQINTTKSTEQSIESF